MPPEDLTRRTVGLVIAGAAAVSSGMLGAANGETAMERVDGIGGFFFRAKDPKVLAKWYADNLGVAPVPTAYGGSAWHTEAGTTVFAPFAQDSTFFGAPTQQWMINFRVRDLDKMAVQLRAGGTAVEIDPQTYPNGRFAALKDPEGNPIQLWQPEDKASG